MNEKTLITDLYQLTMAQGYYKLGRHDIKSVFTLSFRQDTTIGYIVFSGLKPFLADLKNYRFSNEAISFLKSLKKNNTNLFEDDFLNYLKNLKLNLEIYSVLEGEIVFGGQPVIKVIGSLLQCQLLESFIINSIYYSTAISTKAARICFAANGQDILEFGLRRAAGTSAANTSSRAAFIGGFKRTSNLDAAYKYSIPVSGTQAHSWVLSFENELQAFESYAKVYNDDLIFLVDSYDTIQGVKNAIEAAKKQSADKNKLYAIRIDSGDLAYFSQQARDILDSHGYNNTKIIASNDLDEYLIESLKAQQAKIDIWSVGTKLVSTYHQLGISAVYKLTALQDASGNWIEKIKISNDINKIYNPGNLQTRRFIVNNKFIADAIYSLNHDLPEKWQILSAENPYLRLSVDSEHTFKDLIQKVFIGPDNILIDQSLPEINSYLNDNLKALDSSIKRLINPHSYPAGLEFNCYQRKSQLIFKLKKLE